MSEPEKTITLDEALAMLDRQEAEAKPKKPKKPKTVEKVKDLIVEGAKQGRGGLGLGTKKQLDILEKEGY